MLEVVEGVEMRGTLKNDLLCLTLAMMHKVCELQQDGSWYKEVQCCPRASHLSNQPMEYCKPPEKESL